MKILVLGTGPVGRALAGRLDELGHEVSVGTRDPGATLGRSEPDGRGTPPYAAWADAHPGVALVAFAQAAGDHEVVVNAVGGEIALDVLAEVGDERLGACVLMDISNPIRSGSGFPPQLFVSGDDSLAEQIQRAHPGTRVVKTLNTLNNQVMVHPEALGEATSIFVSGDDADAKALVTGLLEAMGHQDVIDLGGITTARGAEMWLVTWVEIATALGTSRLNVKVVR